MTRAAIVFLLLSVTGFAQEKLDPVAALAKAHTVFVENQSRQRFWNWTTVSERTVVDKEDTVLEKLPSVTIESPIRSDGKRCDALLAWGDGVQPYLANASAEERCAVENENPSLFKVEAFLLRTHVKVQSKTATTITLTISEDKQGMNDPDPSKRCTASVRGVVTIDRASSFPIDIQATMPRTTCLERVASAANHYGDGDFKNVSAGVTKGSFLRFQYQLQRDRSGDGSKDFWIATHRYTKRPLQKGASKMIISGRAFTLESTGDRRIVIDMRTTATELSAESSVSFEPSKEP